VGLWIRDIFEHLGLQSFAKTSGSKGLQLYVPLNTAITYDQTKPFARAIAQLLEDSHSDQVVSDMKKALRVNKVFVDWSQNDDHKTTVNVYSLRAKEQPTVSTPVSWKEVEQCLAKRDPELLVFTADQVLKRAEKLGDLFAPVLTMKQKLPAVESLGKAQPETVAPTDASNTLKKNASKKKLSAKANVRSARPKKKAVGPGKRTVKSR
jgi:bifunctional non-homologous end joining protein LigD